MEQRQDERESERGTRPARRAQSSRRSTDGDERPTRRSEGEERRTRQSGGDDERRPRRAAANSGEQGGGEQDGGQQEESQRQNSARLDARGAVRSAVEQLSALTRNPIESVVGIERDDETWRVTVDVLEDAHIPSTSDILAEYEVRLSADGELLGYSRGRRYVRGRAEA
jgi:gas vesicle protein GvpO